MCAGLLILKFCVLQVCGSGLRSIAMGYEAIKSGGDEVVVCGGQENMTRVSPFVAFV